jgi:putative oxidoreductase
MGVDYDQGRFETRTTPEAVIARDDLAYDDVPTRRVQRRTVIDERTERTHRVGDAAYAILRITVGAVMLAHGLLKLQDVSAWIEQVRGLGVPMPATMAVLSIVAEAGGGVALILGLFTRFAGAPLFFNMLAAILTVHAGHGLFAKNGGYEYPLLLLMTSVLFVAEGSRRYGIDASFWRAIHRRRDTTVTTTTRPHYAG